MTYYNPDQSGENLQLDTLLSVFSRSSLRGKSRVQIIAIGAPEDVLQLMYRLHHCECRCGVQRSRSLTQMKSCGFTFRMRGNTADKSRSNCDRDRCP